MVEVKQLVHGQFLALAKDLKAADPEQLAAHLTLIFEGGMPRCRPSESMVQLTTLAPSSRPSFSPARQTGTLNVVVSESRRRPSVDSCEDRQAGPEARYPMV
ncbi:hypothetical protein GCM10009789_43880 [Kribbella sancticallisti]|uniref:Uncharacterized protein n=1 Tax=Kribbella sancticallisti TaxID=460087 RepID=A0ABP4PPQ6_9ACTN